MVLPCVALILSPLVLTPRLSRIVSKRLKDLRVLGSVHGSDLQYTYGPGELLDYLIHFATHMDPNGGSSPHWPVYAASRQLMTLLPAGGTNITHDTYRDEAINYVTNLSLSQYQ
jgi:acetylcholinesterase